MLTKLEERNMGAYHFQISIAQVEDSACEWLGRRTRNLDDAGLSTPLTTTLELFLGRTWFNSSVMLVNGQLAYYVKLI